MTLADKAVWVTGASRGIGASIADHLASQGAKVLGTATTQAGADAITERLSQWGSHHVGAVLDVSNAESVEAFFKEQTAPQILVNNAGITRDKLLLMMGEADWQSVIDTNLTAVYRLCRLAIRSMIKAQSGRIINIGSVVAQYGNAGQVNYAAAKAGLVGLTKALAAEVASRQITVNVIAPGFIQTDMTEKLPENIKTELLKRIPLARLGEPSDVAHAVAFLAGDGAGYITGQTLHVNGGMWMGV